jgi:mannose-1-phosphate guanylyltransferase
MPNLYTVILAGGSGTRFWPLSRARRPKQLLPLVGEISLVRATQMRFVDRVPRERRLVLTNQDQAEAVAAELEGLIRPEHLLREPVGRDTAAAAILGALAVRSLDPEGIMAVLPADHVIDPAEALVRTIEAAAEVAADRPVLVTIGIPPDHPATGYGYIRRGRPASRAHGLAFHEVESFHEKPDRDTAEGYLDRGGYYWNSGMFVWSAATFLELAGRFVPETLERLEPLVTPGKPLPGPETLREAFLALKKISVDHGILEKAPRVEVVEAPFSWDDVGAWTAIENHLSVDQAGNAVRGPAHLLRTSKTTIVTEPGHLVATLGVEELVIVHTEDATLVARKADVQDIKQLVEALKEQGLEGLT